MKSKKEDLSWMKDLLANPNVMGRWQEELLDKQDRIESLAISPEEIIYAETENDMAELLMVASMQKTMGATWDHKELIKRIVLRPAKGDSNEKQR